ncbi:glycine cleavage system aminomethyltransferase GcvT [Pelovirga terrestris]|uniref:Aminomethyltransferase n=1 Tax=Pelovirga terrestris TaxID=2771352 RepID=A0A8J6QLS5_9BACT|nr:glycine cleavage system aminomethyltransferase GcvT [Pelovirga terrestris]MBD1400789.1 glycine cleavage system aminomethyltransferase GcvT [Pelovirga terrestris]
MKKTPLNAVHRQLKARMVDFGGWDMPVQYSGVIAEHQAVRTAAGLFDVSHMGEIEVSGRSAQEFLQYVTTNDLTKLTDGQVQYSALCYEHGGVVDDLTLYRFTGERFMLCVNAANISNDLAWLLSLTSSYNDTDLMITDSSDTYGLLALQGPQAQPILAPLTSVNLDELSYYHFTAATVAGIDLLISRTGYTGEDGFELYCPADSTVMLWQALMQAGSPLGLMPCGLGARDTLRLEKGYALYGHEISAEILPLEARLGWITKLDKGEFVGRAALHKARELGIPRQLIGLKLTVPGVPRQGYPVLCDGREVGFVTSGTSSPTLKQGIALALVDSQSAATGKSWQIEIRRSAKDAETVSLPFV